jgi:hypothetical protein
MAGETPDLSWLEHVFAFAKETGVGWWEGIGGIALLLFLVMLPPICYGIAAIIKAKNTNKVETDKGRERLGLENDSKQDKISTGKEEE